MPLRSKPPSPNAAAFLFRPIQCEAGISSIRRLFAGRLRHLPQAQCAAHGRRSKPVSAAPEGPCRLLARRCPARCVHPRQSVFRWLLSRMAVVSSKDVLGVLAPSTHGSTYGGDPLACAVGRHGSPGHSRRGPRPARRKPSAPGCWTNSVPPCAIHRYKRSVATVSHRHRPPRTRSPVLQRLCNSACSARKRTATSFAWPHHWSSPRKTSNGLATATASVLLSGLGWLIKENRNIFNSVPRYELSLMNTEPQANQRIGRYITTNVGGETVRAYVRLPFLRILHFVWNRFFTCWKRPIRR